MRKFNQNSNSNENRNNQDIVPWVKALCSAPDVVDSFVKTCANLYGPKPEKPIRSKSALMNINQLRTKARRKALMNINQPRTGVGKRYVAN